MPPHEQNLVDGVQWRVGIEGVDLSLKLLPLSQITRQPSRSRIGLIDEAKVGRGLS